MKWTKVGSIFPIQEKKKHNIFLSQGANILIGMESKFQTEIRKMIFLNGKQKLSIKKCSVQHKIGFNWMKNFNANYKK